MIINNKEYSEPEIEAHIKELNHKICETEDQNEYLRDHIADMKKLLISIKCHLLYLIDADIENTMNRNRTMELIEKIDEYDI